MRSTANFQDRANQRSIVSFERWRLSSMVALLCASLVLGGCAAPLSPTASSPTAVTAVSAAPPTATARVSVSAPFTILTVAPTSTTAEAIPTPTTTPAVNPPATAITAPEPEDAVPPERDGMPQFSDVAARTPADVVAYLQGRLPGYAGSGPQS